MEWDWQIALRLLEVIVVPLLLFIGHQAKEGYKELRKQLNDFEATVKQDHMDLRRDLQNHLLWHLSNQQRKGD